MKRMNLLPPELRPRDRKRPGSSYLVVGALAAAILAMLAYGVVLRGVRSDETRLAELQVETEHAAEQAEALSPYARFGDMKETRARSVREVAETRFDYERLTRELARILPSGVSISSLDVLPGAAGAEGDEPVDVAAGPASKMSLSGCAPSQNAVADTLDRLRALTGAASVTLGSSGQAAGSAAGGSERPYLVESSGGGGGTCAGDAAVSFDATVELVAEAADEQAGASS